MINRWSQDRWMGFSILRYLFFRGNDNPHDQAGVKCKQKFFRNFFQVDKTKSRGFLPPRVVLLNITPFTCSFAFQDAEVPKNEVCGAHSRSQMSWFRFQKSATNSRVALKITVPYSVTTQHFLKMGMFGERMGKLT